MDVLLVIILLISIIAFIVSFGITILIVFRLVYVFRVERRYKEGIVEREKSLELMQSYRAMNSN